MLNVLVLMGRITKDPSSTKSGETTIVNFDVAVDNIRKEKDGTRGTTFLPVVCFNTIGENVINHLHKGSKVAIKGAIQQRNFIRKDGSKGSVYEVIADSIEFLDPKPLEPTEQDLEDGPVDSCGSLDGEKYKDENGKQKELKYDPYTGKALNKTTKR